MSVGGARASKAIFAAALFLVSTNVADAATLLPKEIQGEFFNGKRFTSMVFSVDGKVTRKPQAGHDRCRGKVLGGFCTTWKGSNENCYTLLTAGEKKWSVMKGKASVGTWSK
jgi:hypothetical protein